MEFSRLHQLQRDDALKYPPLRSGFGLLHSFDLQLQTFWVNQSFRLICVMSFGLSVFVHKIYPLTFFLGFAMAEVVFDSGHQPYSLVYEGEE